jgi:hypothetical protein
MELIRCFGALVASADLERTKIAEAEDLTFF